MSTDGQVVCAVWRPDTRHIGFQSTVHGGLISTVLDEMMVWVCAVRTRRFSYCGELAVRFRKPLAPDADAHLRAELVRNLKDRLYEARAEVTNAEGELMATAAGKYIPIAPELVPAMLEDVVGELREFVDVPGGYR